MMTLHARAGYRDDRLVLATWKENQPKVWNTLRPALEQRGRYYLEKYRVRLPPPPCLSRSTRDTTHTHTTRHTHDTRHTTHDTRHTCVKHTLTG
jgi:hypothetical protein